MTLAFNTKHPYIAGNRWIASLNNGETVFQDNTPKIPSAWLRLKEYIHENGLHITQLRLQAYGKYINAKDDTLPVQGFWFMNFQKRTLNMNSKFNEDRLGIGYIRDEIIYIKWINHLGAQIDETRSLYRGDNMDLGAILNAV